MSNRPCLSSRPDLTSWGIFSRGAPECRRFRFTPDPSSCCPRPACSASPASALFFLLPLFITDHGGTKADIGLVMGVMALAGVLSRPLVSNMVDRLGRKRSTAAGCLILAVLPLIYLLFSGPLAGFYLPLLLVRAIHGLGEALFFTASFTYIIDIIPEPRLNEGIGMFGTSGLVGMAVGPMIGEAVIRAYGFPVYFLTTSFMSALGLILLFPLPESFVPAGRGRTDPSFFSVLFRRRIFLLTTLAALFGVGLAGYGGFVAPYGQELGLPFVSLYFLAYSAAAVLVRLFAAGWPTAWARPG
ncbi:MAG: MFS transporter [Thermodesulfobacteriota bacterium]